MLKINEIFFSIQGESTRAGLPTVFIRTSGCHLRCTYCDTTYAYYEGQKMSVDDILSTVAKYPTRNICLTGGEPFRQNIGPLLESLLALSDQLVVQIETNGTLYVELPESKRIHIVCSPKTASLNQRLLPKINSYKYLIAAGQYDSNDGLPIESTQRAGEITRIARPPADFQDPSLGIFVMPIDAASAEASSANTQAAVKVALDFGYRLTLQTHKITGIP